MTVPANLQAEQAPYGAIPVTIWAGAQGGPYSIVTTFGGGPTAGDVAAGTADSGNPVKIGGVGSTTAPTAVSNNQRVNAWYGVNGTAVVSITNAVGATADASTARKLVDPAGNAVLAGIAQHIHNGATWDQQRSPTVFKDINAVALTAGTGATVWTPAASKKFRLMGGWFSSSAAAALIFGDNLVGNVIFRTPLLGAAGVFPLPSIGNGVLSTAANNVLKLDCSANTTVTGCVFGTEE